MTGKMMRSAVLIVAVYCSAALTNGAQAADVEIINRLAVACTLEAPDLSISVDAKSTKAATIDDDAGDDLRVVCNGSGLDKDVAQCKRLIGGTGGSGKVKDELYDFSYVKEIHVFAQIGQWLVCSSI